MVSPLGYLVVQVKLSVSKNEHLFSHLIYDNFIYYLGRKPWCHLDYCLSHSTPGQLEIVLYPKIPCLQPLLSTSLHHSGSSHYHCHLICLNGHQAGPVPPSPGCPSLKSKHKFGLIPSPLFSNFISPVLLLMPGSLLT